MWVRHGRSCQGVPAWAGGGRFTLIFGESAREGAVLHQKTTHAFLARGTVATSRYSTMHRQRHASNMLYGLDGDASAHILISETLRKGVTAWCGGSLGGADGYTDSGRLQQGRAAGKFEHWEMTENATCWNNALSQTSKWVLFATSQLLLF